MLLYRDCTTFKVMDKEIHLYSEDLGYSLNTVAEMGDIIHYLGNETPNIAAAIFAWQEVNGRDLTAEEFRQVLIDNSLLSQAI